MRPRFSFSPIVLSITWGSRCFDRALSYRSWMNPLGYFICGIFYLDFSLHTFLPHNNFASKVFIGYKIASETTKLPVSNETLYKIRSTNELRTQFLQALIQITHRLNVVCHNYFLCKYSTNINNYRTVNANLSYFKMRHLHVSRSSECM